MGLKSSPELARNSPFWLELQPGPGRAGARWIDKRDGKLRWRAPSSLRHATRHGAHWSQTLAREACSTLGIRWSELLQRGLQPVSEALQLECSERDVFGRRLWLTPDTRRAWQSLRAAAGREGIPLVAVSGFRPICYQARLLQRKLDAGQALAEILKVNAAPGFSEHHGGCALDLATPEVPRLEAEFAATAAYAWLQQHARSAGFVLSYPAGNPQGYTFEPWHWCYRPSDRLLRRRVNS